MNGGAPDPPLATLSIHGNCPYPGAKQAVSSSEVITWASRVWVRFIPSVFGVATGGRIERAERS